jgi:hypothetical protein
VEDDRLLSASHREVPVKVTAWIDEGVVPLVLALNEHPGVMTLDSCQGDPGERPASVFFCYRGDAKDAALFIAALAEYLAPHERAADYVLAAEWRSGQVSQPFRSPAFRVV